MRPPHDIMVEAILKTLQIMGWLGIALGILAIVNIVTGTLTNIWSGKETFNEKKMLKGITKVLAFYICATFVAIAFTMLPFINEMITNAFGVILLSSELLNTFSSVGVLGIVVATLIVNAKKAMKGIVDLANLSADTEVITWEVKDNEE